MSSTQHPSLIRRHPITSFNDAIGKPTPSVMGLRIKGAKWARPELRVDVNYRATTREGLLRHASFEGVRED